jgi:hypothetical protein
LGATRIWELDGATTEREQVRGGPIANQNRRRRRVQSAPAEAQRRRQRLEEMRQRRLERLQNEAAEEIAELESDAKGAPADDPSLNDPFQFRVAAVDAPPFAEKPLR